MVVAVDVAAVDAMKTTNVGKAKATNAERTKATTHKVVANTNALTINNHQEKPNEQ